MMTEQTIPPFETALKLLGTMPRKDEDYQFSELLPPPMRKSRLSWSTREKATLFEKHRELGNNWEAISKFFPNKTENIIKSFFYASLRKLCRKVKNGTLPKHNHSNSKLTPDQICHLLDYFIDFFSSEISVSKCKRRDFYMLGMLDTKELSVAVVKKYKEQLINAIPEYNAKILSQTPNEFEFLSNNPCMIIAHSSIQKKLEEVNMLLRSNSLNLGIYSV